MTAQTSDAYPERLRPEEPDEIDVRPYLLALLRWWREIVIISLLAGLATGLALTWLNNNRVPLYTAYADILIARLTSNIELDERIVTSAGTPQADNNIWRASLVQLADSTTVATAVAAELQDELPEELQSPEALLAAVEATIPLAPDERTLSNVIRLAATTADPEISALIANRWAYHLVQFINEIYGQVPESTLEAVAAERDRALLDYQAAEEIYQDFTINNQISTLERQIREKVAIRNAIMDNYTQMLTYTVGSEYAAQLEFYDAAVRAPMNQASEVLAAQVEANVDELEDLYLLRSAAAVQLQQAQIMERTLVTGGEAAAKSNITALQLLKLNAFAALPNNYAAPAVLSFATTVQAVDMTLEEQLTDVRALVGVLEEYVGQLDADIARNSQTYSSSIDAAAVAPLEEDLPAAAVPPGESEESETGANVAVTQTGSLARALVPTEFDLDPTITAAHEARVTTLEIELRDLNAQLAAQNATQRELAQRRDLAWTTYETLSNKLQELSLLRSSANTEVRVGNEALAPVAPLPNFGLLLPVIAVTLLSFVVVAALALVINSLGVTPFLARRAT